MGGKLNYDYAGGKDFISGANIQFARRYIYSVCVALLFEYGWVSDINGR
jgi:hypothetical protein